MGKYTLIAAGFFAGFFAGPFITHWLRLLLEILGVRGVAMPSPAPNRNRNRWYLPLMLLHPVTWLLVGIVYFTFRVVLGHMSLEWVWFTGGFYLSFLFAGALVFIVMRRHKHANPPITRT